MKRVLSVLLALVIIVAAVPMGGFVYAAEAMDALSTETTTESETTLEWEYELYGDGVCLTGYTGDQVDVTVPATITVGDVTYNVVKLGNDIFNNNDSLNSVTLPDTMLEIGDKAFYDCDQLVTIVTDEQLTTIGNEAFYSCDVFNSVIIYDAVNYIGANAFAECPSLTIWCNEGTAGYTYATENGIAYEILNPNAEPETVVVDGVTYYIMNGEAIAIDCDDTLTEVVIPNIVNGFPVTELRETFKNCGKLIKVVLPEGIKEISESLFAYCYNLTNVYIPSTVTKIDNDAFYYCYNLDNVQFPSGLTTIGKYAFFCCEKMSQVILPDSVKTVGEYAFSNCDSLVNIKLSSRLSSISYGMFAHNMNLKNVDIPSNVKIIENEAFIDCPSLQNVNLSEGVETIYSKAFYNCDNLIDVIIPESVKLIKTNVFSSNTVLLVYENSYAHNYVVENDIIFFVYDGITKPEIITVDGITYAIINGEAIGINCDKSVTDVIIPNNINGYPVIELRSTFKDCDKLKTAVLPETVSILGNNLFYNCQELVEVTVLGEITKIGDYAFYCCKNLVTINMNCSKLKEIGDFSFYWCFLLGEITFTKTDDLEKIGSHAFYSCEKLKNIEFPDGLISIGSNAFRDCDTFTQIILPDSVTSIGSYAFYSCNSMTDIKLSQGLTSLNHSAFGYCTSLTSVSIPNNIKSVSYFAFSGCNSLKDLTISDGVKYIYSSAFANCNNLKNVIIPESVITLETESFSKNTVFLVYQDSYAHNFVVENDLLYSIYDGTTKPEYITVEGITYVILNNEAIGIGCDKNLTNVIVPDNINSYTVVELRNTFEGCSNLKTVVLPETITEIGYELFNDCYNLTTVNIPSNVTKIVDSAFADCKSLTNIHLPDTVTEIGDYAFNCCYKLSDINIPSHITKIGVHAFAYCENLTEASLPDSLTEIGGVAFGDCEKLECITIPSQVEIIPNSAFSNCKKLKNVVLQEGLKKIYDYAFKNCNSLVSIIIPESVEYISLNAFDNNIILMVYENSYTHTFAQESDLLYFVMRKTGNPEISFGDGINGAVKYTDGSIATNTTVEILYDDGITKESVVTDSNGAYEFTYAEVGRYTIRATDANGNIASSVVYVKRMNAFDVYVTGDTALTLKKGYSVSGSVNESGANITITDTQGNVIGQVTADENGTFTLNNIPNGEYIIKAESKNGTAVQEVTVFDSDVLDIVINIETVSETVTIWVT